MEDNNTDSVQIEIEVKKLEELFKAGLICANDFRCLNCDSKRAVWKLCLASCALRAECRGEDLSRNVRCPHSIEKEHASPLSAEFS